MTSTAETPSTGPSRGRIIAARALVVLGVVLVVVSVLSNWVKREALDPDTFKSTSQELIAHPAIQRRRRIGWGVAGVTFRSATTRSAPPSNRLINSGKCSG